MEKQTDADFDAQVAVWHLKYGAATKQESEQTHATAIDYVEQWNLLIVHLSNGLRLALPIESLKGLESATPEQLRHHEIHGLGFGFGFPELDVDFSVPTLISGVYNFERWMSLVGKKGGASKTLPKQKAARANGAKSSLRSKKKAAIGT